MIWLLIAFLLVFGNAKVLAAESAVPQDPWIGLALGAWLTLAALVTMRAGPRLSAAELGLVRQGSARAAAIGLLVGLAAALPALAVLRFPPLLDEPVRYTPLIDIAPEALLLRALVMMPLDTALPEELAFRGALFGWLLRDRGLRYALIASSLVFAAWHIVILALTLLETNVLQQPSTALIGTVVAFVALIGGGVLFGLLRIWTGRLAAPVVAHAAFNAAILLALGL